MGILSSKLHPIIMFMRYCFNLPIDNVSLLQHVNLLSHKLSLTEPRLLASEVLTHWGQATHICISKLTIIGSDNGLSPGRRQAIIWTNAGILFIGHLRTNFSEILIKIVTFSFKKMRLKVSSAKRWPFCLGLWSINGLSNHPPHHEKNSNWHSIRSTSHYIHLSCVGTTPWSHFNIKIHTFPTQEPQCKDDMIW